jgi:A/G-specific adenine glycosylase
MGLKLLPQIPPLLHTFTHFRLRIYPQPLQVESSFALEEDSIGGEVRWMTPCEAAKAAIPAPVSKLLNNVLASENTCENHG